MANKKPEKQNISRGMLVAAAAGITAGYYFYASENAKKNRKIAATWANDLKKKVVTEAKKHGTPDKKTLANIVDTATKAYAKVGKLDSKQLAAAAGELKTNWQKIVGELNASAKPKRAAKKVRKAAKKRLAKRGK